MTTLLLVCFCTVPRRVIWAVILSHNRRQNELRHFALYRAFYFLLTSKAGNIAFPPPSPLCNVVPLFELPIQNKHPNTEWRGQGRGVDSFALWSYPIWVQCLHNFVADCVFTLPDSSYFGAKTILSDRASLPHQNSDFDAISVKEKSRAALHDLESGASHIR